MIKVDTVDLVLVDSSVFRKILSMEGAAFVLNNVISWYDSNITNNLFENLYSNSGTII